MKVILIICIIITSSTLSSQSSSSIDLLFNAGSSFRSFDNYKNADINNKIVFCRNLNERKSNYKIELTYSSKSMLNMKIRTGINLGTYNYYTAKLDNIRWPSEINSSGIWESDPNLPHELNDKVENRFIGIPILLRYELGNMKLSPLLEVGSTINYLEKSYYTKELDVGSNRESLKGSRKSINLFGNISIGSNYKVSEQIQLFSALTYSHQLNNLRLEEIEEKLSSYGISIGVRKLFNQDKIVISEEQ